MLRLAEDDRAVALTRKYKVILSNPPFAGVLPQESIRKDLPTNSKLSELLFLGVMMEALAVGGRCAVVVPEGLLSGSTSAHVELRRKLVDDYELLAALSLPGGVFKPYAASRRGSWSFGSPKVSMQTMPEVLGESGSLKFKQTALTQIRSPAEAVPKLPKEMTFLSCSSNGNYTNSQDSGILLE